MSKYYFFYLINYLKNFNTIIIQIIRMPQNNKKIRVAILGDGKCFLKKDL